MKSLLSTLFFLLPLVIQAQQTANVTGGGAGLETPNPSALQGSLTTDELPEARIGGRQIVTKGDHPVDDHIDFSKSEPREDGAVCIEKTNYVEKLERQQIQECWHQNITACHFSSVTEFKSMQEKKCEDNTFHKSCKITFKEVPLDHTVRTCHKPLVRKCSYRHHSHVPVTVCRTWFETTCNSTLVIDADGHHTGAKNSWCEKTPKKICAPDHCAMVEGPEECLDKQIHSTIMQPNEVCDLQPTTDCHIVTSLIPHLHQRKICEQVPKEFCHTKLDSPKLVKKPITMKWCTYPNGDGFLVNPESKNAGEESTSEGNTGGVENVLQGVNLRIQPGFNVSKNPTTSTTGSQTGNGPAAFDNALVQGIPTL